MKLLDRLERRWGWLGIENLTIYLIIAQALVLAVSIGRPDIIEKLVFVPRKVMAGEVWRIFTFMVMPATFSPFWAIFEFMFLYLMGTALETRWGAFHFTIYLLIAAIATMASAFIQPDLPATNAFILGSVFLAFAWLWPDFQIMIMFIIPVRVKWIAWLTWAGYGIALLAGGWQTRFMVLAAIANFLLFFADDIRIEIKLRARGAGRKAKKTIIGEAAFHKCIVCGITEKSHPKAEFRYCPDCPGTPAYCMAHFVGHQHMARIASPSQ
jgi:membrane associated rhomboid family serine protease